MSYILKNTSGLVNTRVTDTGRQKLSQGNFKISYFQIGDSEISYDKTPSGYNLSKMNILEPPFNTQNSSGVPQSNKQSVKYPYFVNGDNGNTYGIPYMDSVVEPVYNRAPLRGFFSGNTTASTINWNVLTNDKYVVSANYIVDMTTLNGSNIVTLINDPCDIYNTNKPSVGDIVTIFYDGNGYNNCSCSDYPTPTTTPTISVSATPPVSPSPTPTYGPCDSPTPTPTPTTTPCVTPTPSRACPPLPDTKCNMTMSSCYPMLTYKIVAVCGNEITLDRGTPNFSFFGLNCYGRVIIYPPSMTSLYDSITPRPHWSDDVINFESICDIDQFDVKVWNMNIPWTETPAGINPITYEGYDNFGSVDYIGTKEYFGYNSSLGQTDTDYVYYYNSFGDIVEVKPEDQKTIAIIHYTNQTIDFFYGEKFALQPYNSSNPDDTTGQARNFKLHIPWLMWHKNPECCFGETFWVDPPNFDDLDLFQVQYVKSTKNDDMNQPGIRYYHLWDTHRNKNGIPSRIGKVFPDSKLVIIDDEEIVAAMSYKSNRNWTLPAPQVSLLTPNTCDTTSTSNGIMTGNGETMYITYRLDNDFGFTNSLHCNYYSSIIGNNNICNPDVEKNVAVRFGGEFNCLTQPGNIPTTTTTTLPPLDCCECLLVRQEIIELGTTTILKLFIDTSLSGTPTYSAYVGGEVEKNQIFYSGDSWYVGTYIGSSEVKKLENSKDLTCPEGLFILTGGTYNRVLTIEKCQQQDPCTIIGVTILSDTEHIGTTFVNILLEKNGDNYIGSYIGSIPISITGDTTYWYLNLDNNIIGKTPRSGDTLNCPLSLVWENTGLPYSPYLDYEIQTYDTQYLPEKEGCDCLYAEIILDGQDYLPFNVEFKPTYQYYNNKMVYYGSFEISGQFNFYIYWNGSEWEMVQPSYTEPPGGFESICLITGDTTCPTGSTVITGSIFGMISEINIYSCPPTCDCITMEFNTTNNPTSNSFEFFKTDQIVNGKPLYDGSFIFSGMNITYNDILNRWESTELGEGSIIFLESTDDCPTGIWTYTGTTTGLTISTTTCDYPNCNQNTQQSQTQYLTTTTTICPTYCDTPVGYYGDKFQILAQKVKTGERPDPSLWKLIDFTSQISDKFVNGYVTQESLTGTTFIISPDNYNSAPYYNLNDYISLTPLNTTTENLNFGDEYYFYGSIETDIQATIYEMNYKINLNFNEFQSTSNPTWTKNSQSYISEVALLDDNKDILVMSKLQSPVLRQGIQQFVVKIDF